MKNRTKKLIKWWLLAEAMIAVGICVYLGEEGMMELGCVVLDPDGQTYEECDQ